jgi:cellulose synthase/poly-beta-1,6-N-acetylglucosamine synthase-like glycosyltransferase
MDAVQIIFWLSLVIIFYAYFGYPLLLWIISIIRPLKVAKDDFTPDISLIITAYNEEQRIAEKLDNTLAQDYPKEKMEIIVVSDCSTDRTDEIVKSYESQGVCLLRMKERNGKHYGQGHGIRSAKNEIVVLTDATTFLEPDGVRKIIRNFADKSIGCVSCKDKVKQEQKGSSGEGFYVRYEMKLRELESLAGSLVGVSGCFYAVRKHLCQKWVDNMSSDFYLPILTQENGLRTIIDPEAIGHYEILRRSGKEFGRKVRTVVHGLEVLFRFNYSMNIFKYGIFSMQILSHKLCRWLVPLFMCSLLITNLILINTNDFFTIFLGLQILFYFLALLAGLIKKLAEIPIFKIPLFFVMVNLSIIAAWYYYLTGQEFVIWEPTKR